MGAFSFLKHRALSWSGLTWRAIIYAAVAVVNLWFWFSRGTLPTAKTCYPIVFFFSRQKLEGSIVIFFKVVGIIFCVYAGIISLILAVFALKFVQYIYFSFYQRATYDALETVRPGLFEEIQTPLERVSRLMRLINGEADAVVRVMVPFLNPEFWAVSRDKIPKYDDLIKAYVQLSSRKAKCDMKDRTQKSQGEARYA